MTQPIDHDHDIDRNVDQKVDDDHDHDSVFDHNHAVDHHDDDNIDHHGDDDHKHDVDPDLNNVLALTMVLAPAVNVREWYCLNFGSNSRMCGWGGVLFQN